MNQINNNSNSNSTSGDFDNILTEIQYFLIDYNVVIYDDDTPFTKFHKYVLKYQRLIILILIIILALLHYLYPNANDKKIIEQFGGAPFTREAMLQNIAKNTTRTQDSGQNRSKNKRVIAIEALSLGRRQGLEEGHVERKIREYDKKVQEAASTDVKPKTVEAPKAAAATEAPTEAPKNKTEAPKNKTEAPKNKTEAPTKPAAADPKDPIANEAKKKLDNKAQAKADKKKSKEGSMLNMSGTSMSTSLFNFFGSVGNNLEFIFIIIGFILVIVGCIAIPILIMLVLIYSIIKHLMGSFVIM